MRVHGHMPRSGCRARLSLRPVFFVCLLRTFFPQPAFLDWRLDNIIFPLSPGAVGMAGRVLLGAALLLLLLAPPVRSVTYDDW